MIARVLYGIYPRFLYGICLNFGIRIIGKLLQERKYILEKSDIYGGKLIIDFLAYSSNNLCQIMRAFLILLMISAMHKKLIKKNLYHKNNK